MPDRDALAVLRKDHQTVKQLFTRFEKAGDRAHRTKQNVADQILLELAVHATIEEELFYPMIRSRIEALEDDTLEALEEHHVVKLLCSEIEKLPPTHERFDAKVTVLMENVRHHIQEEETTLFPAVRRQFTRAELLEMGELLEAAKVTAPTRAHPHSPDEPPGNVVVGLVAKPVDAVVRRGRKLVENAAGAVMRR